MSSSSDAAAAHNAQEVARALKEAKAKGLPESWTVKIDAKRRRKWIAPNGRSCESIPKAMQVSVELGLLPPDTVIPTRPRKRTSEKSSSSPSPSSRKRAAVEKQPAEQDPESDPEESLVARTTSKTKPTTVHWDPDSADGSKVGRRLRVWDSKKWQDGRVLLYDSHTHKHKVQLQGKQSLIAVDAENCAWLRLEVETVQWASRLVWALVKGFAWWPGMVMEGDALDGVKERKGQVLITFFGSDDLATLPDKPEVIRPFDMGKEDAVISKHKKKRNKKAIQLACEEQERIAELRNQASRIYAGKAFGFANKQGTNVLGKRVQIHRSDVNYPYGDTVVGRVRQYSAVSKKWLLSYEISDQTRKKYESSWINLASKECNMKVLDNKKAHQPNDLDLVPYVHGFVPPTKKPSEEEEEKEGHDAHLTKLLKERCHGCVEYLLDSQEQITCKSCSGSFHVGCLDPSLNMKNRNKEFDSSFVCPKCVECLGCWQHDVAYGCYERPQPPSLTLAPGSTLELCSMCATAYDEERYCPNCAHTWNDVHYQSIKRQLGSNSKSAKDVLKRRVGTDTVNLIEEEVEMESDVAVQASWYNPDTPVWGYTAGVMMGCDECKLWVHAGCAGLTRAEYEETSSGKHPIYSNDFLCRVCCSNRCKKLIEIMQKEDKMYLFAIPVTPEMAPTYHDVIKEPMDLQTMLKRAEREEHKNYAWVRDAFELMVLNALTFNQAGTRYWLEAKRFYHACLAKAFTPFGKGSSLGPHGKAVEECFKKARLAVKMEEQRVQKDKTSEKKDLVAGAKVSSITLPALRPSPDPQSCLPFREVKLKPLEAHFCSWMECCFTCGSSGAMDTMLFCVDCGEAFHSFCAGVPVHSMAPSSISGWRCPNCKICEISGEVPQDELKMIFCDMCDRAFSLELIDPPLKAAPKGLWICGQCVDCKSCGNTSEVDGPSLKYWSRDPEKCYRCGGCDGLVDGRQCCVCSGNCRTDGDEVMTCSVCDKLVHTDCDIEGKDYLAIIEASASRRGTLKYECPRCRHKQPSVPESLEVGKQLRTQLHEQARKVVAEGTLTAGEEGGSSHELHEKLIGQIDWRIRNMWRDEYIGLITEGLHLLSIVNQRQITSTDFLNACRSGRLGLPVWMGQRAARFMQMVKHSKIDASSLAEKNIESLVTIARMAASFLKLTCRALGMTSRKTVQNYSRMASLLRAGDDCGLVEIPPDPVKVDGNSNVIQQEEWTAKFESQVDSATRASPVARTIGKTSRANREAIVDTTNYLIASPVCGWNEHIDATDEMNRWKDPRPCVLCRTCGDDDGDCDPEPATSDVSLIARVGRLLPMPDGNWVHASCALWSSEVYEGTGDDAGMIYSMAKARSRGGQLKCFGCGRPGATLGCFNKNCSRNYHMPCAKACGCVFTEKQQMLCEVHKSHATEIIERASVEHMKTLMIANDKKGGAPPEKETSDSADATACSRVGSIAVHCLGEIDAKHDGFHSERFITPPGYVATRIFWSGLTPRTRTVYVLKVERSTVDEPVFSAIPGDDPTSPIRAKSVNEVYSALVQRVKHANRDCFSHGDLSSKHPATRRTTKRAFGLNGGQFFGFGLNHIRKALECLPNVEAVVAPLTNASPSYRFSFVQPSKESIMALQRKRAAVQAEKALENPSGSARSEGMSAVTASGGSGRITRALVRSAEKEETPLLGRKRTDAEEKQARLDRESNQRKYQEMKSVPLEQRLAARRSHIHGWGLFCKVDIPKDGMIIEYMGEVIRQCVADKREKAYEKSGEGSCYMFRLDVQRIVDATIIGCMARFMNHCCMPNAYAKVITVADATGSSADEGPNMKIVVFANRDIKAGEEITYDYKFPIEDGSLRCTCGAPNCIGRMN